MSARRPGGGISMTTPRQHGEAFACQSGYTSMLAHNRRCEMLCENHNARNNWNACPCTDLLEVGSVAQDEPCRQRLTCHYYFNICSPELYHRCVHAQA